MTKDRTPEIKLAKVKKSSKVAIIAAICNKDLTDNMLN